MNLDALPQAVLLILAEFSAGSLIALLLAQARGLAPESYVKFSAFVVVGGAALTVLASFNATGNDLEGFRIDEGLFGPVRGIFIAFLAATLPYVWFVMRGDRARSLQAGTAAAVVGLAGLGLLAYQVSAPTWGAPGVTLSLLVGALALGFVNEAMILGHWYLVSPKLPAQPLQELTFALFGVLIVQAVLLIVNASVPARQVPETSAALAGSLGSNPAFWLRVGVGLLFPLALAWMAWQSSNERSMMSATGLLYIAVGAVFVGEVLARGLLFVTGSPV